MLTKCIGAEGFEPPTPWSQTTCATKLRYAPTTVKILTYLRKLVNTFLRCFSIFFTQFPGEEKMLIGAEGFEPPTPWSQTTCATKLRYAPTTSPILPVESKTVNAFFELFLKNLQKVNQSCVCVNFSCVDLSH